MFAGALQELLEANSSALPQPSSVYLPHSCKPALLLSSPCVQCPLCTPCAIAQQPTQQQLHRLLARVKLEFVVLMHNEHIQAQGLQKPLKHLLCQPGRVLTFVTGVVTMSVGTWRHSFVAFSKPCWLLETVVEVAARS
jgi:hypothetical protein